MADQDGVEELEQEEVEHEDPVIQGHEDGKEDGAEGEAEGQAEDEVEISIGEESPPHNEGEEELTPAAKLKFGHMRREAREKDRELRELRQQLTAKNQPEEPVVLGSKPTLEGCDYDADAFEEKLTEWHDKKRAVEQQAAEKQKQVEEAQKAWQTKVGDYNKAKAALRVPDFEDAEASALEHLDTTQQQIILDGVKSPDVAAKLIYALGKNPAKLKELASNKNPVQFAFAAADLVSQMKTTQRKAAPPPEKTVSRSAAAVSVRDPKLERLEAEADKTGDRTALQDYHRKLKAKAAA